ncbi:B-cell receptor CD22-like [Scomber japonicus]|uniref:B-cell receptor CD22-like n=1 Tax=Scomber japonicus TaxID=13676 RepID=UPI002305D717|nr:B-cell receptor CD22-like [Scomber japonicus]
MKTIIKLSLAVLMLIPLIYLILWMRKKKTLSSTTELNEPLETLEGQNDWGVTYTPTHICASKGSTVVIRCTYRYPYWTNDRYTKVDETIWFAKESNYEPVDLRTDSEYSGRVQHYCDKKDCTLRITDLRERDSAEYTFRFITNRPGGKYTGEPGVFLTVAGLQVHVGPSSSKQHPTRTELKCHSNCQLPGHHYYIWYKNGQQFWVYTANFNLNQINPDDYYSCALSGYESFPSPPVYAPKLPSVSVSPSGEIIEGSSVTLTCSSDANPEAKYTWYKKNVNPDLQPLSKEPQLVFSSIQSSDSGEYYCTAENQLGKKTSEYIFIDVKYAPKVPSVSVSPSAEIVEGSSVTLNCSSDANPAANYTWYKEPEQDNTLYASLELSNNQEDSLYSDLRSAQPEFSKLGKIHLHYGPKLPSVSVSPSGEIIEGSSVTLTCSSDANPAVKYTWYKENVNPDLQPLSEPQLVFISIQSSDSGEYYCTAENQLGKKTSKYIVDVKYAPKLPSVSLSPSAEIVEGSSVNLTCSSDANPAANYTWYKKNEDSPKASGQIFTITDVRPEHSGNYYCVAQNRRGRHNSTLHLTVAAAI